MRVLLILLLLMGAGYLLMALRIPLDPWAAEEAINSRTLPLAYGAALCGLLGVLWVRGGRERLSRVPRDGLLRLTGLAGSALLFAAMVPRVGLWLAIPFLLVPAMWVMGERRWWALTVLPVIAAAAVWGVVVVGLGVYVEGGRWLTALAVLGHSGS
jgi:hypothetical protein